MGIVLNPGQDTEYGSVECPVAQGLTLTAATTAFLMEPSLHPGLEVQAAVRICRLGALHPSRPLIPCKLEGCNSGLRALYSKDIYCAYKP